MCYNREMDLAMLDARKLKCCRNASFMAWGGGREGQKKLKNEAADEGEDY
jgi:hypothetical protein